MVTAALVCRLNRSESSGRTPVADLPSSGQNSDQIERSEDWPEKYITETIRKFQMVTETVA
jgi:hypothetical protein